MEYQAISADSHINEPPDLWQKRLPTRLRDRGPKIVRCADGGDGWTYEGKQPVSFGLGALAGKSFEQYKDQGIKFSDLLPGNYDPKEHLKDQDLDGVDASVLFPGTGMGLGNIQDKDLRLECMRAYNDWLTEEFCAHNPKRLFGLAVVPLDDEIEMAVAEMERAMKKGHRGVIIPTWPQKQYDDPRYEPFWAAAERLDAPLLFHRTIGKGFGSDSTNVKPFVARIVWMWFTAIPPLTTMIFSGVFDRHRGLKVIAAEANFGWMPFWTEQADDQFRRQRHWAKLPFDQPPSSYIRRQVGATFLEDHAGIQSLNLCPVDNLFWSSDYPHSTTLWPKSREYIQSTMGGLDAATRHKLLAGNSMRVFKMG